MHLYEYLIKIYHVVQELLAFLLTKSDHGRTPIVHDHSENPRVMQDYSADPMVMQDSHSDYSADPRVVQF